jgi:hypothetical protein
MSKLQLYHDEDMLYFDEMMMMRWIFTVLVH